MVQAFQIDYIQKVCLDVMKKLLITLMRGPRAHYRLYSSQIKQITEKPVSLTPYVPREFAGKPISLEEVDRWKAT